MWVGLAKNRSESLSGAVRQYLSAFADYKNDYPGLESCGMKEPMFDVCKFALPRFKYISERLARER